MSIASPSLRSNSTTAPRPSFNNWLTCMVALPSTALTVTGMSYTASSSRAPRGAFDSVFEPAVSVSSVSSISAGIDCLPDHCIRPHQSGGHQHLGDLLPQSGGIPRRAAVVPGNAYIAPRHGIAFDRAYVRGQIG